MGGRREREGGGVVGGRGSSSLAPGVKMGVDAPQRRLDVFGDSLKTQSVLRRGRIVFGDA